MSHPYGLNYGLPESASTRLRAWSGALLVHGAAALALLFAWPQAGEYLAQALPIEVSLIEEAKPPEPVRPPPPPKRPPPPQQVAQAPLPVPEPVPEPPVLATTAVSESPMVAPPAVVATKPVAVVQEYVSPAPPAPAEPLIEARFDAAYLSNPKPHYPMASRRLGEAGVVHLRVHVGSDGRALKVELKTSSGYPRLDQSALDTVTRWHFVPARRGATPVAAWVVVPIIFSLT